MNVLITGGCGFVGSQLVQLLKENGKHNITILDNGLSGQNPNPDVELINADVRDSWAMFRIIPKYEIVVHLAAIVGVPACSVDEQFSYDVNVTGTENIVQNLRDGALIVFASSTSAYGNKVNQFVTEETTLTPLTNYGYHKLYGETIVRRSGNPFVTVRPATAFGLSQRSRIDVLPNTLIYTALTQPRVQVFEPQVIRPFIHVRDFARVLEHAVENKMPIGTYNIGDPNLTMQKGELAKRIAKMADTAIDVVPGNDPDKRNYDVSFNKLLETGFTFETNALKRAFTQIYEQLDTITAHYDEYNVPFHVKEYIRNYGNELDSY